MDAPERSEGANNFRLFSPQFSFLVLRLSVIPDHTCLRLATKIPGLPQTQFLQVLLRGIFWSYE